MIPLPLLAERQALVEGNRELIERFEKKIEAMLARIWGEEKPDAAAS